MNNLWNFGGRDSSDVNRISIHPYAGQRQKQHANSEVCFAQNEMLYPPWWTREGLMEWYRGLSEDILWNTYICAVVLFSIVWVSADLDNVYLDVIDVLYNISYAIHVFALGYKMLADFDNTDVTFWTMIGHIIDSASYSHYFTKRRDYKLGCYYVRLHRAFRYLFSFNYYNLYGSIIATTLKYCYIFMVLRITWAWIWLRTTQLKQHFNQVMIMAAQRMWSVRLTDVHSNFSDANKFLTSLYIVNKMFIPIG